MMDMGESKGIPGIHLFILDIGQAWGWAGTALNPLPEPSAPPCPWNLRWGNTH